MENLRKYGKFPFTVAVLHGGPGAVGDMAAVAKELSPDFGVLEPLQTETSVKGQVWELESILMIQCQSPAILIGHSWGAWLGYIYSSMNPSMVRNLVMIGSGPFEEKYASHIMETRLNRLNPEQKKRVMELRELLSSNKTEGSDKILSEFGSIISGVDSYEPLMSNNREVKLRSDIFRSVWAEACELRSSGRLLEMGKNIECPVVAIHGDHDPHPAEGVKNPLSEVLDNFRFILLEKCGHKPWIEKYARDKFYEILREELSES